MDPSRDPNVKKYVGFWDPRKNPQVEAMMPWDDSSLAGKMPLESSCTLSDEERHELMQRLRAVETGASCTPCFGASWCRLCGCVNGSLEYTMEGWTWPQGYGHYIQEHFVELDPGFRAWLDVVSPPPKK